MLSIEVLFNAISEKWDSKLGTFSVTRYIRPGANVIGWTQDQLPEIFKVRHNTQNP